MFNKPLLGGINVKAASAYLLPPTVKPKKKKQKSRQEKLEERISEPLDKQAFDLVEMIVREKQAEFKRRLIAGDLGGGWNPFDQLT